MAIQPDGKIVVAGRRITPRAGWDFAVARYEPDGTLDDSFDGDGRLTTDFDDGADGATPSPCIRTAGSSWPASRRETSRRPATSPMGTSTRAFGGDGRVRTDFAGLGDGAHALALQPTASWSGRLRDPAPGTLVDRVSALARYEPDGDLDSSFGGDGRDHLDTWGAPRMPSPCSRMAGWSRPARGLLGLRPRRLGGPELGDGDGRGPRGLDAGARRPGRWCARDGRVDPGDFQVGRWNPDGSRDRAFGAVTSPYLSFPVPGAFTDFGFRDDEARAVAIQQDGKIVVVGRSAAGYDGPGDFAVARYLVDRSTPGDADADGVTDGRDHCPRLYRADEPDGCPHYAREVTIRYSDRDDAFMGHVFSPQRGAGGTRRGW